MVEEIKAKTRKELAAEFKISRKTLSRRLEKENIKLPDGVVLPKEQKIVYEAFGYPHPDWKEQYKNV